MTLNYISFLVPFFLCSLSFGQSGTSSQDAILICTLENIHRSVLPSFNSQPILVSSCTKGLSGKNTSGLWYKFSPLTTVVLEFTISPQSSSDDFDFILFENSNAKDIIACMAKGRAHSELNEQDWCLGATGIRVSGNKNQTGCATNEDNFIDAPMLYAGKEYLLYIQNYHSKFPNLG
jgi:hypothetical protein